MKVLGRYLIVEYLDPYPDYSGSTLEVERHVSYLPLFLVYSRLPKVGIWARDDLCCRFFFKPSGLGDRPGLGGT